MSDNDKRKESTVYLGTTGKKISIRKSSKQVPKEVYGVKGLVSYPYNPSNFLTLFESNSIFSSCVKQIARDVAGLGYKLVLKEGGKENEVEKKKILDFLDKPNPNESLRNILEKALIDWGVIGWWGLEVLRNNINEVAEIYHVPAYTFKIHKGKEKFFQSRGIKEVWFKTFGNPKNISAKTGEEGNYDLETRASELIYYKNYYPRSDFYGAPNILSAIGSVLALIGIRDYNLSFFENYGVPAWMIILKGKWAEDSDKRIKNFLDTEIKGSKNANKTAVFKVEGNDSLESTKLSSDTQEGSFKALIQILIDDILMAYSMPGYRIGLSIIGRLGGTNIKESNEIYKNGVVEPLQEDIEDMINHKIIEQGLNCKSYKFKLNDLDTKDIVAETARCVSLFNVGALTSNQVRNLLNLGENYPEGDKYYISSALVEAGGEIIEKSQNKFIQALEEFKKETKKLINGHN
jgi:PBSX family phage portal protein